MQGSWRVIAVFLLVATVATLPGAQALPLPKAQPVPVHLHPAGCHSQESTAPATPDPAPTSYQCCVNGHHAAIPSVSFTAPSTAAQPCTLTADVHLRLSLASSRFSATFVVPSNSPPGATPLRI